jgi:LysM repeat protein
LPRNWDWLVKLTGKRLRTLPLHTALLTALSALILLATLWLLWPLTYSDGLKALVTPTVTPTVTQAVVQRQPTPTTFVPTATPAPLIHVVVEGEVLGLVAEEYGTTVEAILEANNLTDADMLSIGQELVIVGAQRTPVLPVEQTPTPTATPTSAFPYAAPLLLGPADQAVFQGSEAGVVLRWTSVAILNTDEWYEVRVWTQGEEDAALRAWTKGSSWVTPDSLYPRPKGNLFYWNVSVVRRSGQDLLLSPRSPTRRFGWY